VVTEIGALSARYEDARTGSLDLARDVCEGKASRTPGSKDALKKACESFESMLMSCMLKSMRSSVPKSGLFGNSQGEQIFQGLMDEKVCKSAADARGLGVADMMYQQLRRDIR
jgi:Rod binding domain-containing protein